MGLYEDLKERCPLTLSFHDDADGVYSASLILLTEGLEFEVEKESKALKVYSPPFNEYTTKVAVDLGFPIDKNYDGVVVDHHPDHPEKRKYKLYWENVPTGLIVWRHLKDHIPKSQWWRVVGALAGDGQPELTPDEIWEMFPELLDEKGVVYKYKGEMRYSKYPLYIYLSSGVNAKCRIGDPLGALKMCLKWKRPIDAVLDSEAEEAKELLRVEEENIMRQRPVAEIIGNKFVVVRIKTTGDVGMSGRIAGNMSSHEPFKTIVVINDSNGEVSIRGILAKYLANKLAESGFKAGGHPGYCGATVPTEDIEDFVESIRQIAKRL